MKFLRQIKSSIYDPKFYKSLPDSHQNEAVFYFLKLVLLLALIQTLLLALPVFGFLTEARVRLIPQLISMYPSNLTISINNGQASINQPEPYFFRIPQSEQTNSGNAQNFLVIDTRDPYSPSMFEKFSTVSVLSRDAFYYTQERTGNIQTVSLKNVKNVDLNRQFFNQQLNKYSPLLKIATPFVLLFVFAFLFISYLFKLVYLFILALVLFLISRVMDLKYTYMQSYKIGVYAMTLSLIIEVLLRIASPILHFPGFPLQFTIVSAIVFVLNFRSDKKS